MLSKKFYTRNSYFAEIKKHVVKKVYERCDEVSENYVTSHPEDWVLGGQSAILIVDEFPNGYMTENPSDITTARKRNNNSHTIVCIAEANTIPTRMWLHMIEAFPEVQLFIWISYKINIVNFFFHIVI